MKSGVCFFWAVWNIFPSFPIHIKEWKSPVSGLSILARVVWRVLASVILVSVIDRILARATGFWSSLISIKSPG